MQKIVKCRYKKNALHSLDDYEEACSKDGYTDRVNHKLFDLNMKEIDYGIYVPEFELAGKKVDYDILTMKKVTSLLGEHSCGTPKWSVSRQDLFCSVVSVNKDATVVLICRGSCVKFELWDYSDLYSEEITLNLEKPAIIFENCSLIRFMELAPETIVDIYLLKGQAELLTKCGEYKDCD